MEKCYFILKRLLSSLFLLWCALVFTSFMILILPFILLSAWLLDGKKAQNTCFLFLKAWAWIFCTLCFFPIRIKKRASVDSKKAVIYVSNHNSYLDTVAAVLAIPESFKPLGKIEMLKTPIFGLIYAKIVVLIDRKSPESRSKCIDDLKHQLAGGQSILIFPEGTMNRTDTPLANFYEGAFRIAIETQTPIVPLVIMNARNLFPRSNPLDVKPGTVSVAFSDPISVAGLVEADLPKLKNQVFVIMQNLLLKYS